MSYQSTPEGRDPQLWQLAQRRASFKSHLTSYLIVNGFLWILWFFSDGERHGTLPWPAWSTLGWGIGLFFHYMGAYVNTGKNSVEKEYDKLQQNK